MLGAISPPSFALNFLEMDVWPGSADKVPELVDLGFDPPWLLLHHLFTFEQSCYLSGQILSLWSFLGGKVLFVETMLVCFRLGWAGILQAVVFPITFCVRSNWTDPGPSACHTCSLLPRSSPWNFGAAHNVAARNVRKPHRLSVE